MLYPGNNPKTCYSCYSYLHTLHTCAIPPIFAVQDLILFSYVDDQLLQLLVLPPYLRGGLFSQTVSIYIPPTPFLTWSPLLLLRLVFTFRVT